MSEYEYDYDSMSAVELKESVCRLTAEKITLKEDKKIYTKAINDQLKEIDARLEIIIPLWKSQKSDKLSLEADALLTKSSETLPPSPPSKLYKK